MTHKTELIAVLLSDDVLNITVRNGERMLRSIEYVGIYFFLKVIAWSPFYAASITRASAVGSRSATGQRVK